MQQPIRDIVIDLLLDDSPEAADKLQRLFEEDPYSIEIYEQEKINFLIEMFLDGSLSPEEKKEFERALEEDPRIRREINLRREVNRHTAALPLAEALDEAYHEYLEDESMEFEAIQRIVKSKSRRQAIMQWAAAASIVLLIGLASLTLTNGKPVETKIFNSYYQPLGNNFSELYSVESGSLEDAKEKYFEAQYREAYYSLNNLPATINIQTEKEFFLALSLIELGAYDQAAELFTSVIENENFESIPQAYWYLGLCQLKAGKETEAREVFEYIVRTEGFNHHKASRILHKLK